MKQDKHIRSMVHIALATAIICILGPISINLPISPVPISLGVFAIFICAYALGVKRGLIAVLLYILLGLVGLPVFSKFQAGPGVLAGPTGGYIIGYFLIVLCLGYAAWHYEGKLLIQIAGMVIGTLLCYLLGTIWLALGLHLTFGKALMAGVIPFIPADAVKMLIALIVGPKLHAALKREGD